MQLRKLAAILFADIVGYTTLMQQNEEEGLRKVERFRKVLQDKVAQQQGEILQFYGDGCLVIFSSGILALQCAKEIQEILSDKSSLFSGDIKVPLRIGIHIGDIVVKDSAIYGDGVNIASRIESLGVPGSVLFSQRLIADLSSHPEYKIISLGKFHFKNIAEPMEVFALDGENLTIPERHEMKGKLKTSAPGDVSDKQRVASIAVLPFTDMSPEKDQEYFADGIAEEILSTLSQLNKLKVAGRTSSFSFKNKEVTIAEIGETLKVDHILEGSVRKHGDQIRITAQLINVRDGFHIWSNKYDEAFTDIFRIQDAVALNIGNALLEKLAPEQEEKLKYKAEQNSEAYELFLRAKHILSNRFRSTLSYEDFKNSEGSFLAAIELDQDYALAHAGLANLYDIYVQYGLSMVDPSEYNKYNELRISESERAFELDPSLAYVNEVRGNVLLNTRRDLDTVYYSYLEAYRQNPGSPELLLALMDIYFRKGLIHDALTFVDEVLVIDPLHIWAHAWRAYLLGVIGNFEEAIKQVKRGLDINPNEIILLMNLASFYSFIKENENALEIYERIGQINPDYLVSNPYYQIKIDLLNGKTGLPDKITDQPSAALLPIGNVELDYLSGVTNRFEESLKHWWDEWKKGKHTSHFGVFSYTQGSIYLHLENHPMYQSFKDKSWFQEILSTEKDKYDHYYRGYLRPEEIIS